jgi:hypothetical protein
MVSGLADLFRSFARRQVVTLAAFGWQERRTPHGPGFAPT